MRRRGTRSFHSMDTILSVQEQEFAGEGEESTEISGAVTKAKSFFSDNSLEFGKSCEELSWNHRTCTPYRSKTNGIAERANDEQTREHQLYYCNPDWMRSGGRILWNAIAICEVSKTSWQTGKLRMNEDLGNPSKDQ